MGVQDLVTVAQVKTFLPSASSDSDAKIQALITSASDAIMREAEREFAPVTSSATRRFRILPEDFNDGYYVVDLSPPASDLASVTSAMLHPETSAPVTLVSGTDYILEPNGKPEGVFTHLRLYPTTSIGTSAVFLRFGFAYLDITGAWGFPLVPTDVQDVCVKVVRTWMRPDVSVLTDMSDVPNPPVPQAYDLPAFAKRALYRYKRRPNIF